MTPFVLFIAICLVLVAIIAYINSGLHKTYKLTVKPTVKYHYKRKAFLMTKAENDFFDVIYRAIGDDYYVFPQIHLSEILDHKVKYQNWEHALHYINQKSVDFVICDKQYRRPILAIELDDWSHDADDRKQRDANVEHMLREAGMPLLRFKDVRSSPSEEIIATLQRELHLPNVAKTN